MRRISFILFFASIIISGCASQKMQKVGPISGKVYDCRKPSEAKEYDRECSVDNRDKCLAGLTNLSELQRNLIKDGMISIGMREDAVRCAYGEPDEIRRSESQSGIFQQWIYGSVHEDSVYLYFKDGILISSHN